MIGDIVNREGQGYGQWWVSGDKLITGFCGIFAPDELIVLNVQKYSTTVQQSLVKSDFDRRYREKEYHAIMVRYEYVHCARSILESELQASTMTENDLLTKLAFFCHKPLCRISR